MSLVDRIAALEKRVEELAKFVGMSTGVLLDRVKLEDYVKQKAAEDRWPQGLRPGRIEYLHPALNAAVAPCVLPSLAPHYA